MRAQIGDKSVEKEDLQDCANSESVDRVRALHTRPRTQA